MKFASFLLAFLVAAVPLAAYQTGPANRTNFRGGEQAQPATYRSFSNYNNRTWGQGVQTSGVQTQGVSTTVVGSAQEFESTKPKPQTGKQSTAAPAPAVKPTASANTQTSAAQQPAAPNAAPAAGQVPAEASAMLQQVQGMMSAIQGAGQAGQAGAAPAGMPDMSALMGAMGGGAAPAAPAKK